MQTDMQWYVLFSAHALARSAVAQSFDVASAAWETAQTPSFRGTALVNLFHSST